MVKNESLATGLRCLSCGESYPLDPKLFVGCTACMDKQFQAPLDVAYDYPGLAEDLFSNPPEPGLARYAPLLPPLVREISLLEGGTPLIPAPELASWIGLGGELYVKDESRNPTWSHKDRFAFLAVSGALEIRAQAVVVSSTGNHGAAIAAYAAKAGLPCLVLAPPQCPAAVRSFLLAYGAALVIVPRKPSWTIIGEGAHKGRWYPGSTFTPTPTGPPYGVEGYKTIAYEIWQQLGRRVPTSVFVPTGYGELLYGVWKGFRELRDLGLADSAPRMAACEPAVMAPLRKALMDKSASALVPSKPTIGYAIAASVSGYRAAVAIRESDGFAVPVTDQEMKEAQANMARVGLWAEASAAASLAGLRKTIAQGAEGQDTVVCINTSSGFKDLSVADVAVPSAEGTWEGLEETLMRHYGIVL